MFKTPLQHFKFFYTVYHDHHTTHKIIAQQFRRRLPVSGIVNNAQNVQVKVKLSLYRSWGLQEIEAPRIFRQSADERGKVSSPTHRPPLTPGKVPGTHFCQRLCHPQGQSAAGRVKSMKNLKDPFGNRNCDRLACSAIPQPTAPQHVLLKYI